MREYINKKGKAIAKLALLCLVMAVSSALVIFASSGQYNAPAVIIRHEAVGHYDGNQIHRMVVSAGTSRGFSLFGIVMSYDNSIVFPVDSETHEDILPPSNTSVLSITSAPFELLVDDDFNAAPDAWVVRDDRTAFSFDVFSFGPGLRSDELVDVFAFYYRADGEVEPTTFRIEDGREEDHMVGNNTLTSFARPGIMIMAGSNTYVWGPNRADPTHTAINDDNIVLYETELYDYEYIVPRYTETSTPAPTPTATPSPTPTPTPAPTAAPSVVVSLNLAGGSLQPHETHAFSGIMGFTILELPTPTRYGYTFTGWLANNSFVTAPMIASQNMTLYAVWAPLAPEPTPNPTPAPTYTVMFLPGQYGNFPSGETGIRTVAHGTQLTATQAPPNPTRTGHTFAGWWHNDTAITFPLTVTGELSLVAAWTANAAANPNPTPSPAPTPAPSSNSPANPQTSPIQVSFMIFGAVVLTGVTAFGLINMTKKQMAQASQYNKELTRHNREKRITDMLDD